MDVRGNQLAVMNRRPPVGGTGTDEQELLRRAGEGDRSAFRVLVERHEANVYYLALGMTHNHHDAEDLVQEVFLKAYRHLAGFRSDSSLSTWLYRITVNAVLDQRRRKRFQIWKRSVPIEPESPALEVKETSPEADPERSAHSVRIREEVDRAIERLSPLEKSVFVLRHYNELSIREVAEVLDRAEGTIKNTLFRALAKMRRELRSRSVTLEMEGCP